MKKTVNLVPSWFAIAFTCVLVFSLIGCGGYSSAEHVVDPSVAKNTLKNALESWQRGESIDALQQKTPQVVVQDMDWKSGAKLLSFEMQGEGEAVDANLICQVKLKLDDPRKGNVERKVSYIVGTSPVLTVFRQPGG